MRDGKEDIVLLPSNHSIQELAQKYARKPEAPSRERLEYLAKEKARMDKNANERWLSEHQRQDAYNQGYQEGVEKGYEGGRAQGIALSERVSMMIVAKRLMDQGITRAEAASLTGLSEEDLPD